MKDAKGHGSNPRGNMSVPDRHQYRIAVDTVKNPMKGMFLGGPNAAQAEAMLRDKFGHSDAEIAKMKGADSAAASELARGNPKAGAAPVHPGASGPQYNRGAVNNAIASSNRAGRRIGGREASMIHSLLKGRH